MLKHVRKSDVQSHGLNPWLKTGGLTNKGIYSNNNKNKPRSAWRARAHSWYFLYTIVLAKNTKYIRPQNYSRAKKTVIKYIE